MCARESSFAETDQISWYTCHRLIISNQGLNQPKKLSPLPCLVICIKCQIFFTSPNVLLERGSEKAFNECQGVINATPSAAEVHFWLLIIDRWQAYCKVRLAGKSCSVSA